MEIAVIVELKKIFEASANEQNGVEFWLARDLQELLGYSDWRIFLNTIVKSKITCNSVGEEILDHFVDVTKKVKIGSGAERELDDIMLTRYACYLIPQNKPLADFLPTITITAKQLATEITNYNVKQNDLKGEHSITGEHVKNNKDIRNLLGKSGIQPEQLPAEEDINKLKRRIKSIDKVVDKKKLKSGK